MNHKPMKEQLDKIRAKCVELLAIAEKRSKSYEAQPALNRRDYERGPRPRAGGCLEIDGVQFHGMRCDDAAFIVSCAGIFERSLLSTIAAIDAILESSQTTVHWHAIHQVAAKKILTAWEGLV